MTGLRPEPRTTPELINGLAATPGIRGLSVPSRGRLINASEGWWDRHDIVESWFEDSDAAQAVLDTACNPRGAQTALWSSLKTRRDWWARIIARAAAVLESAEDPDAASFAACAAALIEGRDLKKIPVLLDIHEQTIGAWLHDNPDLLPEPDAAPPAPERKGEFAKLLKGNGLTAP